MSKQNGIHVRIFHKTPIKILVNRGMWYRGGPGVGLEVGRSVGSAAAELPSWPLRKADGPVLPEKTGAAGVPNADAAPVLKSGMCGAASALGVGATCIISD